MIKPISCVVFLLLIVSTNPLLAADRGVRGEQRLARLTVRVTGFPAGTQFRVDTEALYRIVDPFAAFGGNPPRGVQMPLLPEMVQHSAPALRAGLWQAVVPADGSSLEQQFDFEFSERLLPVASGRRAVAEVSMPVTFAHSDSGSGAMRRPRRLGAANVRLRAEEVPTRCFVIEGTATGYNFRIAPPVTTPRQQWRRTRLRRSLVRSVPDREQASAPVLACQSAYSSFQSMVAGRFDLANSDSSISCGE